MSKRLLLLAGNYYPEPTGIGKYNGELIDWLSENNYQCTVISTYPYYPHWKVDESYARYRFWYKKEERRTLKNTACPVSIIRIPHYVPNKPTGLRRLISDLSIFCSTFFALIPLLFSTKFDFILTVAPPFELGLLGVLYKKIRGSKFLYHIQDLQIDAALQFGMLKSSVVAKVLYNTEKYILRRADFTSTISEGMIKKVLRKCAIEVAFFPNWVDTDLFYPIENKKDLKLSYGFKATDQIILYSGAIGEKQGLEAIVRCADFYRSAEDIKFVICGSGPYKKHLVRMKEELKLDNLIFFPLQPFNKLNSFLNVADVHLVLQRAKASDLVLPSKLTSILSVGGIAIVSATKETSLYNIMSRGDMGILIEPEDQLALNSSIALALETELSSKRESCRSYALNNLGRKHILNNYIQTALEIKKEDAYVLPLYSKNVSVRN